MMTDKDLTDDVLDEIIFGAKTSMEQYLALSLKAERAANRQQNETQNIPENIPATHFKPVADLYEMQFDDGRTCAFHTDGSKAVQWLLTCDGNKVQEYVKLERYQEALSGNSPVIHEDWISVSDQAPDEYDFDIWVFSPSIGVQDGVQWDGLEFADDEYQFRIKDVSHWMKKIYPAAPQQE